MQTGARLTRAARPTAAPPRRYEPTPPRIWYLPAERLPRLAGSFFNDATAIARGAMVERAAVPLGARSGLAAHTSPHPASHASPFRTTHGSLIASDGCRLRAVSCREQACRALACQHVVPDHAPMRHATVRAEAMRFCCLLAAGLLPASLLTLCRQSPRATHHTPTRRCGEQRMSNLYQSDLAGSIF